jgi:4'-phosphopantetheinyl transferase EntD
MLELIALDAERVRLGQLAAVMPCVCWDRLLFSAKESVYKTWFPLARRWLGFESADILIDPRPVRSPPACSCKVRLSMGHH